MSGKLGIERGQIEPEAAAAYEADFDVRLCLQLSIATSLKRLADAFNRGEQT